MSLLESTSPRRPLALARHGARFGVASLLALVLTQACSDPASPAGYRDYTPPSSGAGGAAGTAGTTSSPEGGDSGSGAPQGGAPDNQAGGESGGVAGGSGGGGGGGGRPSGGGGNGAGSGAGGTTGSLCGNGKTDAGEECDDGNTVDLDGCSSTCESACEQCLEEFYGEDPEYLQLVDLCTKTTTVAQEGPAANTPRSALCLAEVKCFRSSGCATAAAEPGQFGLFGTCYCALGQLDTECTAGGPEGKGDPKGPCVKEVENATESKLASEVSVRFSNFALASGAADALVRTEAYAGYCSETCSRGTPVDDCTRCAAGELHDFSMGLAVCPLGFNINIVSAPLARCVRENCTAGTFETCLQQDGPCSAALTGLAPGVVSATSDDLQCRAMNCAMECFKP
jgi:cysteine-rich repeat protein